MCACSAAVCCNCEVTAPSSLHTVKVVCILADCGCKMRCLARVPSRRGTCVAQCGHGLVFRFFFLVFVQPPVYTVLTPPVPLCSFSHVFEARGILDNVTYTIKVTPCVRVLSCRFPFCPPVILFSCHVAGGPSAPHPNCCTRSGP